MTRRDVDRADIQAIAYTAFGSLTGAAYLMLRVVDASSARRWLGALKPASVADLGPEGQELASPRRRKSRSRPRASERSASKRRPSERFGPEFVDGMTGSPNRSQRLGDVGANAPEKWTWGVGEREPHILLMLFAGPERIAELEAEATAAAEQGGLALADALHTSDMGGVEPFGFADGVSQPTFDWDRARRPGTKADRAYTNFWRSARSCSATTTNMDFWPSRRRLRGRAQRRPSASGGRRRGRERPWQERLLSRVSSARAGRARLLALGRERGGTCRRRRAVARRVDGRTPQGGRSAARLRDRLALPGVDPRDRPLNGFLFDSDPDGLSCPIGAHIRRANPRTGDAPAALEGPIDALLATLGLTTRRLDKPTSSTLPWEENTTVWPYLRHEDDAVASARFHRLLRRGREYGRKIDLAAALDRLDARSGSRTSVHLPQRQHRPTVRVRAGRLDRELEIRQP